MRLALLLALLPALAQAREVKRPITIGIEYAMPGPAKSFAGMGVPAFKPYPDAYTWGTMQNGPKAPFDFTRLDRIIREYQQAGFRDAMIVLKAKCLWASKDFLKDFTPRAEYMGHFERWVQAVVERYDGDGKDDMPGLRWPVRYYELGSEFSTFEPTPTPAYLDMLDRARRAARAAMPGVVFLHAAFLPTTAFRDNPGPARYEAAFAAVEPRIMHKSLKEIRAVLDRPKSFDAVNFHALGDPDEVPHACAWLRWEMKKRGYDRPLVISDTSPTPFIAWGPATLAKGKPAGLGIVVPPATEKDRPRLAAFFQKLTDEDGPTLAWTHRFVAADMVKKVVVSAEQGVAWINTSFMEDLTLFKSKALMAGAGVSAWGGMADTKMNVLTQVRTFEGPRPAFHAIAQVQRHLKRYDAVERVKAADPRVRLYAFRDGKRTFHVGWLEAGLLLPGDKVPSLAVSIPARGKGLIVERMIESAAGGRPERTAVGAGKARCTLTPTPVYVLPE